MYEVEYFEGCEKRAKTVTRQHSRQRKFHTVAFVGVTGDPKQDARPTQYFITKENEWWYTNDVEPEKEPITRSHTHSGNCAGHFKSAEQMNFLSRMTSLFVWLTVATWPFGALPRPRQRNLGWIWCCCETDAEAGHNRRHN